MQPEQIITILISIFGIGTTYGTLSSKIKHLEAHLSDYKDIGSKVAKIEVQIEFIVEKVKKL